MRFHSSNTKLVIVQQTPIVDNIITNNHVSYYFLVVVNVSHMLSTYAKTLNWMRAVVVGISNNRDFHQNW